MSGLKGYMGKVLKIDLSSRTSGLFPWTDEDRKRTIGGKIMAADILFQHVRKGMKAFDEDNWIVITTGPLTGSGCPNTSRFNISTISPLTGIITSSNCGGNFGLSLKRAGYDACIITGRAEVPTTVHITRDSVNFEEAEDLWGMRISETQAHLPEDTDKLVIGPAGEHKVLYSSVFSGERTSGRGGVGAVFGDKNLKAVTAKGTGTCEIARLDKLRKFNRKWVRKLKTHPLTGRQLPKLGTAGLIVPMQAHGILATRNFGAGRFDGFEKVSGEVMAEEHLVSSAACTTCAIRCARMVTVDGQTVKGPELETLGLLGPNILNDDLEMILRWNRELDELGMDTISAAGSIAFAMELYEKGLWDCGLRFGKTDNISETFRKIAFREGDGDELANGTKRMSEKFGGKEFAMHVKGMELAAYEPRRAVGQGLGYATANRGGCHLNAGYMVVVEGLGLDVDSLTPHGKAALTIMFQNLMEAISATGSCLFTSYAVFPAFLVQKPNWPVTRMILKAFPYLGPVVNLLNRFTKAVKLNLPLIQHTYALNYVCDFHATIGTALTVGAHGYNMERMTNVILGQKKDADVLPKRLTETLQDPDDPRTRVPLEKLKKDYYRARGWKDGIPTYRTLKKFGVDLYRDYYDQIVKEADHG